MGILSSDIDDNLSGVSIMPEIKVLGDCNNFCTPPKYVFAKNLVLYLLKEELSKIPLTRISEKNISEVCNIFIKPKLRSSFNFAHIGDRNRTTDNENIYEYVYRPSKYIKPQGFLISFIT